MFKSLKLRLTQLLQDSLHRRGYHIIRLGPDGLGGDPYADFATLTKKSAALVLDIGANQGQTVRKIRQRLPESTIHCFEPSPATFALLEQKCAHLPKTRLWNQGMGAEEGQLRLFENSHSEMSSFLPLGSVGWGEVLRETSVPVATVDNFCQEQGIDFVDILKSDTQGFDLQVLRGAGEMLSQKRIGLVYSEISLAEIYKGAGTLDEFCAWMREHDYQLVTFYRFVFRGQKAVSTDALFAHPEYLG